MTLEDEFIKNSFKSNKMQSQQKVN